MKGRVKGLTKHEIKQIGGRAGRFKTDGYISSLKISDLS